MYYKCTWILTQLVVRSVPSKRTPISYWLTTWTSTTKNLPQWSAVSVLQLLLKRKNIYAHRRQYHYSYKACLNINNCSFKELCSFNHNPITEGASICYQCGTEFLNINDLMIHKKNSHKKELCSKFQIGKCTKNPCWYTHKLAQPTQSIKSITPKQPSQAIQPITPNSGFWQVKPNTVPPTAGWQQTTQPKPNTLVPKDQMMNQILEIMKQHQAQIFQMNQALQAIASIESTANV